MSLTLEEQMKFPLCLAQRLGVISHLFPMKILLRFLLVALFSFAVVKAWHYVTDPRTLPIRHVKIVGSFAHVERQPLQALLTPYLQAGFLTTDFASLKQCVLGIPWVEAISIERRWPDTIVVHISEQQAVAQWGNDALLAANGQVFKPPVETFPRGLPLLQGKGVEQAPEVWESYKQMAASLAEVHELIMSLDGSDQNSWCLMTSQGTTLLLTKVAAANELNSFVSAYASVFANSGRRPMLVDLRYPNGFAVKW